MKKPFLATSVALIAVLLLAGCYQIRTLSWSDDVVRPGEATKASIGLTPLSGEDDGYFFINVEFLAEEGFKVGGVKFDVSKVVYNKPKKMSKDLALQDAIYEDDESNCRGLIPTRRGVNIYSALFRTNGYVTDEKFKPMLAKLKATMSEQEQEGVIGVIETGMWTDDGDLAPEPDSDQDNMFCSGRTDTSVFLKGN